jgi:hypothetical protein
VGTLRCGHGSDGREGPLPRNAGAGPRFARHVPCVGQTMQRIGCPQASRVRSASVRWGREYSVQRGGGRTATPDYGAGKTSLLVVDNPSRIGALARPCPKRVVGPALRAGRAQRVCKIRDREAILASSVASLRMSCSRPAAERGPYLLFQALAYRLTLFGWALTTHFRDEPKIVNIAHCRPAQWLLEFGYLWNLWGHGTMDYACGPFRIYGKHQAKEE